MGASLLAIILHWVVLAQEAVEGEGTDAAADAGDAVEAGEPFIGSWPFFLLMGVLLIGLIFLLRYMQNKRDDDDD